MNKEIAKKELALTTKVAKVISRKTGLDIGSDHVHESFGRYYYIQELIPGFGYILHHYRGPFFVEISHEDWNSLLNGEISVDQYVDSTQWLYGYYWGGGSMVSGGYYTKLENPGIHDAELIKKVMLPMQIKGRSISSGYPMTKEEADEWRAVKDMYLHDNRVNFFLSFDKYFKGKFGYSLHGLCCDNGLHMNQIELYPNTFDKEFELVISSDLVWALLTCEGIIPDPEKMKIKVFSGYYMPDNRVVTCKEDFEAALDELSITKKWEDYQRRVEKSNTPSTKYDPTKEKARFIDKIIRFFGFGNIFSS